MLVVFSTGGMPPPNSGLSNMSTMVASPTEDAPASPQVMDSFCVFQIKLKNSNRALSGILNAECGLPDGSPPWGNFGVDSNHGSRYDGLQYEGWSDAEDDWDNVWSACTTEPEYSPPNCNYYNSAGCTEQVTDVGYSTYADLALWMKIPRRAEDEGCEWFDGRNLVLTGNFIKVYEMDHFQSPDDFIDMTGHGDITILNRPGIPGDLNP